MCVCVFVFCFERERSARKSPVSHYWHQVLRVMQSSFVLPAGGSPGHWVKPLSHQPDRLVHCVQDFTCNVGKKRNVLKFFKSYGLPLHVLSLVFDIFIMPSHFCSCFSESLPRICLGDSLLLTNLARHRNPHPPLLDSPTWMASPKKIKKHSLFITGQKVLAIDTDNVHLI